MTIPVVLIEMCVKLVSIFFSLLTFPSLHRSAKKKQKKKHFLTVNGGHERHLNTALSTFSISLIVMYEKPL